MNYHSATAMCCVSGTEMHRYVYTYLQMCNGVYVDNRCEGQAENMLHFSTVFWDRCQNYNLRFNVQLCIITFVVHMHMGHSLEQWFSSM